MIKSSFGEAQPHKSARPTRSARVRLDARIGASVTCRFSVLKSGRSRVRNASQLSTCWKPHGMWRTSPLRPDRIVRLVIVRMNSVVLAEHRIEEPRQLLRRGVGEGGHSFGIDLGLDLALELGELE